MKTIKSAITGLITGFLNGLFGAGGGTVLVISLEKFLGIQVHKAHATSVAIILPITILSSFIYLRAATEIDWFAILYVSIGGLIGGYLGAKYLRKISGNMLHKIFGIFMIVAAIRMII